MELIDKEEFIEIALAKDVEAFVIHVTFLTLRSMMIHLAWKTQMASLLSEEVILLTEYTDFADLFLKKLAEVLPKKQILMSMLSN